MRLLLTLTLALFIWRDGIAAEDAQQLIWVNVPFVKTGSYFEFNAELSKTRAEARGELLGDFALLLMPLAASSDDVARLAQILANTIVRFDALVRQHAQEVHEGIPVALTEDFKSGMDRIILEHRLNGGEQRTGFTQVSKDDLQKMSQKKMPSDSALKLIKDLRFVAYGSYAMVDRTVVRAVLTLEDLITLRTRSFSAQGPIEDVGSRLAAKVFEFLQGEEYPDWHNPQPQLEWIAPGFPQTKVRAELAVRYCQGQKARLPYTVELLQAALGGNYRKGGIGPLIKDAIYIVADRNRYDEQYYYSTREDAQIQTGGPIHTSAGHGPITGYYWCVRGEPSRDTLFDQAVYRLIRQNRQQKRQEVAFALEYVLAERNDLGAEPSAVGPNGKSYEESFRSPEGAIRFLSENGVFLQFP